MSGYKIDRVEFRDIQGVFLWEEPMVFKRLYSVGQTFIEDFATYRVKRVAVMGPVQIVNVLKEIQK